MDDMLDLLDLRQEIMEHVENVLKKAQSYQRQFDGYTHLWLEDRAEFLKQFLLYGRVLTNDEMEAYKAGVLPPESPPTIDQFKEQVKKSFFIFYTLQTLMFFACLGFLNWCLS